MAKTKTDIALEKAEALYTTIVSQKVSTDLGLAIKAQTKFGDLDKDQALTICKIVLEFEKKSKAIDLTAEESTRENGAAKTAENQTEAK